MIEETNAACRLVDRREVLTVLVSGLLAPAVACRPSPSQRSVASASIDWPFETIRDVAPRIASGDVSPVDLTDRLLERIATVDRSLKSYATVTADQAMAMARVAETEIRAGRYRGPLHGVPIAVKDLCY